MARIIETKQVEMVTGFNCDICRKDFTNEDFPHDPFEVYHTCGFMSKHDLTSIEATICDDCTYDLIKNHVPGAKFR